MTRSWLSLVLTVLLSSSVLAFLRADPAPTPTRPASRSVVSGGPFHAGLLAAARSYKSFGYADATRWASWAPLLCRQPGPQDMVGAVARGSASKDADTHGGKLYFLFAKQRADYLKAADKTSPVGQVIVKESWTSEEATEKEYQDQLTKVNAGIQLALPFARKGEKLYRTGKQKDLFIMLKLDPATPETDNGWVYGTVSADAKTVTSAGRVESCMSCHTKTKQDRLFGLPQAKADNAPKSARK